MESERIQASINDLRKEMRQGFEQLQGTIKNLRSEVAEVRLEVSDLRGEVASHHSVIEDMRGDRPTHLETRNTGAGRKTCILNRLWID